MRCEIKWHEDMWQQIKDCTMTTINKDVGVYPTSEWKCKLLLCEHSPIRSGRVIAKFYDIPSFVATHLVRHHIGIEKYVSSRRSDRGFDDEVVDRMSPVDMTIDLNFQAIINISRKRRCMCASAETRAVWWLFLTELGIVEPELASVCVPDCIYRGKCYEMFGCGYDKTESYRQELKKYRD